MDRKEYIEKILLLFRKGEGYSMLKAILFGAAGGGMRLYEEVSQKYEVVAFMDNDEKKWGKQLFGISICSPQVCINKYSYDYVIITSAPGLESIKRQCIQLGIGDEKIITSYVEEPLKSRKIFLKSFASILGKDAPEAECAEAGVFEGDFAQVINRTFPNRKLHLFDTFEGFDSRDIEKERDYSKAQVGDYRNTSVEMVLSKMLYPDNCIVHKGYFPDTARGIENNFCFVNLDLDLYEPTYNGLVFFSDKMVEDGIILVHDYFAENFKGPKKAVDKFCSEYSRKIMKLPIGDGISVMLAGF